MKVSTKTLTILSDKFETPVTLQFKDKINLLSLLNANKVGISQACGGFGTCTTCRVFVEKNLEFVSERTDIEIERALERHFLINERLCCQSEICESLEIRIP